MIFRLIFWIVKSIFKLLAKIVGYTTQKANFVADMIKREYASKQRIAKFKAILKRHRRLNDEIN